MDNYDKAKSRLNNSTLVVPPAEAHASGDIEFPTCESDLYVDYIVTPTIEIINAIEGAGLTRDGTDRTQLLAAIQALVAASSKKIIIGSWGAGDTSQSGVGWSMTRTATGRYVITFTTPFAASNTYNCIGNAIHTGGGLDTTVVFVESGQTDTVVTLRTQRNVSDFNDGVFFIAAGT